MSLFISLEGPDGSGKSTQAMLLAKELRRRGYDVTVTREPGGTPLGEHIREMLLAPGGPTISPMAMALLLAASRSQLVQDVIRPALESGGAVVADRYADSTMAYQSYGYGVAEEVVCQLRAMAAPIAPDATIYVDVPPEVGLSRVADRGPENRLDAEALAFHERVRRGYLAQMSQDPERWVQVDGKAPIDEVHENIMYALEPRIGKVMAPG